MTLAFGKDARGRVRAVGPISKTQYVLSAPARAKVAELQASDGELKQKVNDLGGKMEVLIEGFGSLCQIIKELKAGQTSMIGSNSMGNSQDLVASPTLSGTHDQSPTPIAPVAEAVSPAHSAIRSAAVQCSLLNMDGDIIAKGEQCTGIDI